MVLAGQIALADILLDGRLEVGLGRGHAWLMEPANVVLDESVERYPEAVEILLNAVDGGPLLVRGQVLPGARPAGRPEADPEAASADLAGRDEREVGRARGRATAGASRSAAPRRTSRSRRRSASTTRPARRSGCGRTSRYIKACHLDEDNDRAIEEGERAAHELHPLQRRADRLARPHARGQAEADRRALRVLRRRRLPEHAQPLLPAAARPRTSSTRAARTRSPSS